MGALWVMAKGDGREVGDSERTGSSCVFISCSWYTREQLTWWKFAYKFLNIRIRIVILTTEYLYRSCMISLHDIMIINVLIAKGMYSVLLRYRIWNLIIFFTLFWFSHVLHAQQHKYLTNVWCLNTRGNSFGKYKGPVIICGRGEGNLFFPKFLKLKSPP
jgi:hypothetical protein